MSLLGAFLAVHIVIVTLAATGLPAALASRLLTAFLLTAAFTLALILLAGLIPLATLLASLTPLAALLTTLLAALVLLPRLVGALLVFALLHVLRLILRLVLHVGYSSDLMIRHYGRAAGRAVDVGQYRPPCACGDFALVGFRRHGEGGPSFEFSRSLRFTGQRNGR
jgi:hypothetical protein